MVPEIPEEAQKSDELQKLSSIATDVELSSRMRIQAINIIGEIPNHDALMVLLNLAANDKLEFNERDLALKRAREIIKKGG
jgi:hypothetical protein